ncbi:MAG: hypothetical protein ACXADH_09065 [Candidatus Kariarchaeaceae archaeon]|jgi:hypothetical protein
MSDTVLEVIQRWEATGFLYGLPLWEKEELSLLYDDAAKLILSKKAIGIPRDTFEAMNEVVFPVVRRLYRRVGVNFDIENMMSVLLGEVEEGKVEIMGKTTKESNPIVEFSVNFADNYEDQKTSEKRFSDEEYIERVDKILTYTKDILLSKKMVSFVDRTDSDWKIIYSDEKKSSQAIRLWNQKVGMELIRTTLMDTNRGI